MDGRVGFKAWHGREESEGVRAPTRATSTSPAAGSAGHSTRSTRSRTYTYIILHGLLALHVIPYIGTSMEDNEVSRGNTAGLNQGTHLQKYVRMDLRLA